VREILEPNSPSIGSRIDALNRLHSAGIRTWAFIAPMLPMDPENLARRVAPHVDFVKMDGMNYPGQIETLFRRQGWTPALSEEYAQETARRLRQAFGGKADDAAR
jgi:DNA repair photolyase